MGYKARFLPSASEEVAAITTYLQDYSTQAASNFVTALEKQLKLLTSGVVDFGLSHIQELAELGYHACRVNSYALLYYYEDDSLVIAHVFHQRQDYARLVDPTAGLTLIEGGGNAEE